MEKEFVPYNLALQLKELGFDLECFGIWQPSKYPYVILFTPQTIKQKLNKNSTHPFCKKVKYCVAPLYQQVTDWFRINHKFFSYVDTCEVKEGLFRYEILVVREDDFNNDIELERDFKTFEEAREACIKKLIELATK